jgi:PTH1 family peptidyl-tRNA hydrolase
MAPSHVIVGLGNPGPRYENTPHNVGWEVVERLTERWRTSGWGPWKGHGVVAEGRFRGRQVVLAKPTTFMNLSGEAVAPLLRHHGVDTAALLVVSDDIALPLGRTRLRMGGSSGGHRGLLDVIETLDSAEFARLRIGVAPEEGLPCAADRWVLSKWTPERREHLAAVLDQAVACIETMIAQGVERAMGRFNGRRVPAPGEPEPPEGDEFGDQPSG